jgi:hypothetical protein
MRPDDQGRSEGGCQWFEGGGGPPTALSPFLPRSLPPAISSALSAAIREKKPLNDTYFGADSSFTACLGRLATYSGQEVKWEDAVNSNFALLPDNMTWDTPAPVQPNPDGTYNYPVPGQTKLPWA